MGLTTLNEFSFLTFLAGGLFIITGVIYKVWPPKKRTWYGAMQLKTAVKNKETWQESIRFAAIPIIVAGLTLSTAGLLPMFFSSFQFFTFSLATALIMAICLILVSLVNRHINGLFDEQGNRRDNA